MPSKKTSTARSSRSRRSRGESGGRKTAGGNARAAVSETTLNKTASVTFFPIVTLALLMWVAYRAIVQYPVWFDETIGKAIFFGFPVWLYITITRDWEVIDTFGLLKLRPGLLQGLAYGGLMGFAGVIATVLAGRPTVAAAPVFAAEFFWMEMSLALFTGFWETLFFFSFVMIGVQRVFRQWSLLKQVVMTALIFVLFHIPNAFLTAGPEFAVRTLVLLSFFAVGQALIFARTRNGYALTLSHAIWGMVLLVHLSAL